MKTSLEYIASRLHSCQPICEIHLPDRWQITELRRYHAEEPQLEHVLYLMGSEEPQAAKELPVNLVYVAETTLPLDNCNWLCLKSAPTDEVLERSVREVSSSLRRYYTMLEKLVQIMAEPDMIRKCMELCYEFWQMPVAVFDTGFKLLAVSSRFESSDSRSTEILENGFMSLDSVKALKGQNRLQIYLSREPYQITAVEDIPEAHRIEGQRYGYIDVPVRAAGKVIACLTLIATNRRVTELDADCLLDISRFISLALQRDGAYMQSVANPYETLFRDVLRGSLADEAVIAARLTSLGKQLKPQMRVAVLKLNGEDKDQRKRNSEALQSELRSLLPGALTAYYQDHIVLLVSDEKAVVLDRENSRFLAYVKISKQHVGFSRQFTSLTEIRKAYEQAIHALRLGQQTYPEDYFYGYDRFVLMHELEILSQSADLKGFCIPGLLSLAESKRKADRDLLTTLYYYILYSKDQTVICERLHIHRSTLFYRINKIEELLGIDLGDSFTVYMVTNSFHILRYIKLFTPES